MGTQRFSIWKSILSKRILKVWYITAFFALASVLIVPTMAEAHAFGGRYDLPLPLWMFVSGGAAAVFLSFVIMVVFMRYKPAAGEYPTVNLLSNPLTKSVGFFLANKRTVGIVRAIFTSWFLLIITTGFWGNPNPLKNLSIVMVWVVAWVGLAFICSLLGNFWALINPWNAIYSLAESGYHRATSKELSRYLAYPKSWGTWPAFIFLFAFAWLEINWSGASRPFSVATVLTAYSWITLLGMFLYGREEWLRQGEAFSVLFALFARFAITEVRVIDPIAAKDCVIYDLKDEIRCINGYGAFFKTPSEGREWNLRPPGVGLRIGYKEGEEKNVLPSFTLMCFVLLALATVTYDGFVETNTFKDLSLQLFGKIQAITNNRFSSLTVSLIDSFGLASFPILFLLVYLLFTTLIAITSGPLGKLVELAPLFVFSVVPIAIAYHLSHYISLLAIQGQLLISGISDPFGFGWDLFGTANYQIDITIINAKFVWYFSLIAIVIGHITAVYLAHAEAMIRFADRGRALVSQIPMLVLMVGYTMLSLWLIAEPIVE